MTYILQPQQRRLIVMPEYRGSGSGYQKAVASDLDRLKPTVTDVIVYFTNSVTPTLSANENIIKRPGLLSRQRWLNVLSLRVSSELRRTQLEKILSGISFDEIICGDVTLYRAIKELYPRQAITVRLHNFFTLVLLRNYFLPFTIGWIQKIQFRLLRSLEKAILADPLVTPVFITKEDYTLFRLLYPNRNSQLWEVVPAESQAKVYPTPPDRPVLVWLGGISQHKKYSLLYFIKHVYTPLRTRYPAIELHLYGKGTEKINDKDLGITGHGYWPSHNFPFDKKALFINPDLLGGGVKLKINDWLTNGIPFISTPFGVDGYTISTSDHILVEPIENWEQAIPNYFIRFGLIENTAY